MSQRERRRKDQRGEQAERRGPTKPQVAAGATVAVGVTLAAAGSAQAATFTVSNLNDAGAGSLRQAINDANGNGAEPDNIVFASGLSGTIGLSSGLPQISYPTTISGPGAGQITVSGVNTARVLSISLGSVGPVTVSGLTLANGNGGILASNADLTLSGVTVANNTLTPSSHGGGVAVNNGLSNGGSLTVLNSTISGNSAGTGRGGGIYTDSGDGIPSTIRNSTISGNEAGSTDYGGGAYFDYSSPATVENSTIYGNRGGTGAGLYHFGAYNGNPGLSITGSTISHNTAARRGGGVACYGATSGAGTIQLTEAIVRDTIVFGNTAPSANVGNDISCDFNNAASNAGTVQAAFSLLGSVDPGTTIAQTGPDIFGVDPQLGPLASNGGPTQTQALKTTSPAIDKGAAFGLTSDQRGVLRPIDFPAIPNAAGGDGSDIGAFELQPSNKIKLGKLKRNKHKGTGKQVVKVPLPAAGTLTIKGKGLKTKSKKVGAKKKVKLPVIPKGNKRAQEDATGSVKLRAKVIYKPVGNASKTLKRKLKLLKLL